MAGLNGTAFVFLYTVFAVSMMITLQWNQFATAASGAIGGCAPRRGHPEGDLNITVPGCDPKMFNVRVCDGWCPSNSSTTIEFPDGFRRSCSACVPTHFVTEAVLLSCSGEILIKMVQGHAGCKCKALSF